MVAFSSASMANTIADEEVIVENKKEVKEEKVTETKSKKLAKPTMSDCLRGKFEVYNAGIEMGYSPSVSSGAAYSFYFNCMAQVF